MESSIVRPGDPRYADLTTGMNQRYASKPDYVRLPRSTEQVAAAVRDAVSSGRRLSVRSGGHCFEDFVFHPDVRVLLDLSGMDTVYFDDEHRAFAVEAGARLLDAYERLYRGWGVTIPGGICYSVGAGGHVTGGGYGLLSRQHGLTVDHLYGVEVVVADADGRVRPVVVTRDSTGPEGDLWWAHTGGGGGNFGVVTRFLFSSPGDEPLVRPPEDVLVAVVALPWDRLDEARFARLLGNYGQWHWANRDAGSPGAPLSSLLMLNHRSNGCAGLVAQIDANAPGAARVLEDYLGSVAGGLGGGSAEVAIGEFGPMPGLERPRRLPWLQATRYLGTNTPILNNPTVRAEHKSAYTRTPLTGAQLSTAYRQLTRPDVDNPNAMLVAFSYGGRIGSVAPADTACAQRDSIFKLLYQSFWTGAEQDAANLAWVRDFYREMYSGTGGVPVPGDRTDGCYVNYPDADLSDPAYNTSGVPWHTLYYKDNYPRLRRAKAAWDPGNVFRHAQSVRPG
ncbi:FAD-binding oxidoreductase [Amycolatopsis anabasis]|uniref:FAD-binding oxidoreductase n=1 Tax=Amycolatopsis anabasis TaxID=1840409 RepID=UPI00131B9D74|nr:FAD-binding oxidoreductase [Amycolatopsis anabasis]